MLSERVFSFLTSFEEDFWYPMDRAASCTFRIVSSEKDTFGLPLKIMDTVDWEISSAFAMSRVVTFFRFPIIAPFKIPFLTTVQPTAHLRFIVIIIGLIARGVNAVRAV